VTETVLCIEDFKPKTLVRNHKTNHTGIVIEDGYGMMSVCAAHEVSVVYDGTTYGCGTDYRNLEITGTEQAVADLIKCGAGKGAECCRFLTVGEGPECERFGPSRMTLIMRKMRAQRDPAEPFPQCQLA
jgi:hypothetical protein